LHPGAVWLGLRRCLSFWFGAIAYSPSSPPNTPTKDSVALHLRPPKPCCFLIRRQRVQSAVYRPIPQCPVISFPIFVPNKPFLSVMRQSPSYPPHNLLFPIAPGVTRSSLPQTSATCLLLILSDDCSLEVIPLSPLNSTHRQSECSRAFVPCRPILLLLYWLYRRLILFPKMLSWGIVPRALKLCIPFRYRPPIEKDTRSALSQSGLIGSPRRPVLFFVT